MESLSFNLFDIDRLPVAIMAILLSAAGGLIIGPVSGQAGPFFWRVMEMLFGGLGSRLDRTQRPRPDLVMRGFVITAAGIMIAFLAGQFLQTLAWSYPMFQLTEILALSLVLSSGAVWKALWRLHKALENKNVVEGAYYTIAVSTRSNLASADDYTITRVGMGFAARMLDKGIVAPVFWYVLAGLPGAFVYAGAAALSWRFGKDGFSKGFGAPALAAEKIMGFVPGFMAGFLLALAAVFTPTAMMSKALQGLKAAGYAEGGMAAGALAWGLNVSLGGTTTDLEGSAIKRAWIGPEGATAKLEAIHLYRALYMVVVAHILFLATLVGAIVVSGNNLL